MLELIVPKALNESKLPMLKALPDGVPAKALIPAVWSQDLVQKRHHLDNVWPGSIGCSIHRGSQLAEPQLSSLIAAPHSRHLRTAMYVKPRERQ